MHFGKKILFSALLALVVVGFSNSALYAQAKHVITMTSNFTFDPSTLMVSVGDTVEWQGSFGAKGTHSHYLESLVIPSGASNFENGSGTVFDYPVAVAGTYNYDCYNHNVLNAFGMKGNFAASPSGVLSKNSSTFEVYQNSPNPFSNETKITFNLHKSGVVLLHVFDMRGISVATLVQDYMEAGPHTVTFDASTLPSGAYYYDFDTQGIVVHKQMVVQK